VSTSFSPVALDTERLRLRWPELADAPALYAIFSDPEVTRYGNTPPQVDVAQADARIRKYLDDAAAGDALTLFLERRGDRAMLGVCSLHRVHQASRRAEIGYSLGRAHWGQGYMNEALNALVAHAFGAMDLNRLEADIDPRNVASARTLERLGFEREGVMRERWIVGGEVSDTWFYGLLRRDYLSRR